MLVGGTMVPGRDGVLEARVHWLHLRWEPRETREIAAASARETMLFL